MKVLIDHGARVIKLSNYGETPLSLIPATTKTKQVQEKLEAILTNKAPQAIRQEKSLRKIYFLLSTAMRTILLWGGWDRNDYRSMVFYYIALEIRYVRNFLYRNNSGSFHYVPYT